MDVFCDVLAPRIEQARREFVVRKANNKPAARQAVKCDYANAFALNLFKTCLACVVICLIFCKLCVLELRRLRQIVLFSMQRIRSSFLQRNELRSCFRTQECVYKFCLRTSGRGLQQGHSQQSLQELLPMHELFERQGRL